MPRIFISYRRADSVTIVGRIYDHLENYFGSDEAFKDVDDIPVGQDFRDVLNDALNECEIMLVIIGKQWVNITDDDGNKRLDNPSDWVRLEVEAGLSNKEITVIPVLVNDANLPKSPDLPDSLVELSNKQLAVIREDPDFRTDVERLIDQIEKSEIGKPDNFSCDRIINKLNMYLQDRGKRILLRRFVHDVTSNTTLHLRSEDLIRTRDTILKTNGGTEIYEAVFNLYAEAMSPTLCQLVTLGALGNERHQQYFTDSIHTLLQSPIHSDDLWNSLPCLMASYAFGLGSLLEQNWNNLAKSFDGPKYKIVTYGADASYWVKLCRATYLHFAKLQYGSRPGTISPYILPIFQPILRSLYSVHGEAAEYFDLFEFILCVKYLQEAEKSRFEGWIPVVALPFANRSWKFLEDYWEKEGKKGENSEVLKYVFNTSPDHLLEKLTILQKIANQYRNDYNFVLPDIINFAAAYERGLNSP